MSITIPGKNTSIVVILGMHRSGTSAYTHALEAMGFELGTGLCSPNEWNMKGQFEHPEVNRLNDRVLSFCGKAWDSISPPDLDMSNPGIGKFRDEAIELISRKFEGSHAWAIKDPRMCRLQPFWEAVFVDLKVDANFLCVIRNPLDVALSLKKRDGFSIAKGCWLWAQHTMGALAWATGKKHLVCNFEDLINQPENQIDLLAKQFKGADWIKNNEKSTRDYCSAFIDRSLVNGISVPIVELKNQGVPAKIIDFYQNLQEEIQEHRSSGTLKPLPGEKSKTFSSSDYHEVISSIESELAFSRENQTAQFLEINAAKLAHAERDKTEGLLRQAVQERDAEIRRARQVIDALAAEINAAKLAHAERDKTEGLLRQAVQERDAEIGRARQVIDTLAAEINAAKLAHAERDKTEGLLRQAVQERDAEIGRARQVIDALAAEINAAKLAHAERDKTENSLRETIQKITLSAQEACEIYENYNNLRSVRVLSKFGFIPELNIFQKK